MRCNYCNGTELQSRGIKNGVHSFFCTNKTCPHPWNRVPVNEVTSDIEYGQDYINVICSSKRVLTEQDIQDTFHIDPEKWELKSFRVKTSEGYRKDRSVDWEVRGGKVTSGKVKDSGKMLVVPLFHVSARYEKRVAVIAARSLVNEFITEAKKFSPKYKPIKYKKLTLGYTAEIQMPDLQLGRMVMASEANIELDPSISVKAARESVYTLLDMSGAFPIKKFVFPIGNDFFDANNADNMTVHGTPMRDDPRWQRTWTLGKDLLIELIDAMTRIAPVDVPVIPGNHDEERIFYLGEYLEAWYHRNENVNVDNREVKRKYYAFDQNIIGLTHGYSERLDKLAALMPYEVAPDVWAKSQNREWHLGDKHHKKDIIYRTHEFENGVVVRLMRSLASPSVWEFDKGLVGSLKAAEAFIWHPERGVVAQFTA